MHLLRTTFLLVLLTALLLPARASDRPYAIPAAGVAWTFGGGFTWYIQFQAGWKFAPEQQNGPSAGFTWRHMRVLRSKGAHRITGLMVHGAWQGFSLHTGFGTVRKRWGVGGINQCGTAGFLNMIEYHSPEQPWLYAGLSRFSFEQRKWRWKIGPYVSIHAGGGGDLVPAAGAIRREIRSE